MNADKAFGIAGMIVAVAGVTVVVTHKNSAAIIRATGQAFSGAVRAAMGH